jgi:hypothetical protein
MITNTGAADAMGVNFTDTIDPNTTLVGGSLKVSPIAVDDTYNTIGNVNISVPAGSGLLFNDLNPGGMGTIGFTLINATPFVSGSAVATTHGSVTVNTDGSFTYTPTAGYAGPTDTFTYTLGNGTGLTDMATVTINISGMIWFVNNDPAAPGSAPGDGRLINPFRSFGGANSFNTIATDAAGDAIFIYTGTSNYTGGVTLLNNQKLIGQGAGASILAITGYSTPSGANLLPGTMGTNPTISAAAANITLGSGNTVRGVTLNGTAAAASNLTGSSFGTLTLAETAIGGTGQALNLSTGTLSGPVSSTAAFTSISSTGSSSTGISLTTVGGLMSSGSTTIATPTGVGIGVNTSSVALSLNNTTSVTNSGGTAVNLTTNTGAITFGTLNITNTTSNKAGLNATDNSGVLTITSGTINTGSGTAVNITKSSGATPLNVVLTSVSANGAANGIALSGTSSSGSPGGFTVVGTGSANSGGTISSTSGADNAVAGNGVYMNSATDVSLSWMHINNHPNFAVLGTNVTNFDMDHTTVDGANGSITSPRTYNGLTIDGEASVAFANLFGSASITNCTIKGGINDNIALLNYSGTLNFLSIQDCTIRDNHATSGNDGIHVEVHNSAVVTVKLGATGHPNTWAAHRGDHIEFTTSDTTATGTLVMINNTLSGLGADKHPNALGQGLTLQGIGDTNFNVSNNTCNGAIGVALNCTALNGGAKTFTGTIANNLVGTAGTLGSGSVQGDCLVVENDGDGTYNATVTGNTFRQWSNGSGFLIQKRNTTAAGSSLNVTATGNSVIDPNDSGAGGSPPGFAGNAMLVNSGTAAGHAGTTCVDIGGAGALKNTLEGAAVFGSDDLRVRQRFSTTVRLPGYGGGGGPGDTASVQTFLSGRNTLTDGTVSATVDFPGSGGGFIGGAACTAGAMPTSVNPAPGTMSTSSAGPNEDAVEIELGRNLQALYGRGNSSDIQALTQDQLDGIVQVAVRRWMAAGISHRELARLEAMSFKVADLTHHNLALPEAANILIDRMAMGYGWFVDPTPYDDRAFEGQTGETELHATEYGSALGRMDLLTVVMRALGYGLDDGNPLRTVKWHGLMQGTLDASVRRLPTQSSAQVLPRSTMEGQSANETPAAAASGSSSPSSGSSAHAQHGAASRLAPQSGETVTQSLGTIPVNEKVTLTFQVTINLSLPPNVCTVTNPAAGSGFNVTGSNFTSVTIAPDSATIVKSPTIGTCPTDITKNTDPNVCTAVTTFPTPTSDACPAATVTCVPASGFAFVKGTTTVTCTAANGNPPDATCKFTVMVTDNQAPVFTGCTNQTINTAAGVCTATATYTPTATDNCDGSRPVTCVPTSGSTFNKGVTTVTCMASDTSSNSNTCMFTVTVNDNQAPVVTCPPSGGAFVPNDCYPSLRMAFTGTSFYSNNTVNVTLTNPLLYGFQSCTGLPNVGSQTINFNATFAADVSINAGPVSRMQGPAVVSLNATFVSQSGNTKTYSTEMTQLDVSGGTFPSTWRLRESPTLHSNGQIVITTITGGDHIDSFFDVFTELSIDSGGTWNPGASSGHIAAVQSTDSNVCNAVVNYAAATATDNCDTVTPTCVPASGSTFSKGVTTVTCSATDTSNLTGNCTFTVTVVDAQAPTLSCPGNISVVGNACSVQTYTTPTASDNCPSPTVACAPPSGTCFAVGTTTVTCTATDTSGNTGSCSFTVSVIPCTINCPGNIVDNVAPGTCAHVETYSAPTTTGMCGVVTCSPVSGSSFAKGVTTVTCTSAAGPSCNFTVTINDNEAPVLSGCNNVSAFTAANACSATVNYTQPTASDVCDGSRTVTCIPASGQTFNKGVTTVSCSASDLSSNTGTCMFTVTVTDNVPPAFTGCSNVSAFTAANSCNAVVNYTQPTATDNCDGARPVVCNPASGSTFNKGVTTVTCTASDANAPTPNIGTCMFTVTVTDNVAPVLTGCTNLTANTASNSCTAVVTYTQPTANDNCDGARTVTCAPVSGTAFAKGVTTVSCSASDLSSNTGNCTFTVTVTDNVAPVFSGCTNVSAFTASNSCDAVVNYTQPTATDNCDGARTVTCSPTAGSVFPKGVTTVSCSASDTSGNPANCTFTVTVTDNVKPVLSGCNNVTANAASNACTAVVTYTQPTANDNCDGARTVTCSPASGSNFSKGVTTVSCSASDTSSNTGNCTFTVTVNDTTPPVITCPSPVVHGTDPGVCNAKVTYPNATATDNCTGVGTPTCTPASGTTFQKGVTTVTCSVTDASNNPASCTFTVTVNDTENPTVTCPNNMNFTTPGNSDPCGMVSYATPSGSDNCGVQSVVCAPASGFCFPVGMTTVTCTVTDTSGNKGQCTFKIMVSNPCTITCPPDQMASTGPGATQCGTVVTYPAPTTTGGGCGTVACSPASGSFFPVGMTTVTCTTNGPSCTFKVTVVDNTPPVFPNCEGITAVAQPSCPFATSTAVSFTTPAATDNCPGTPSVTCVPPAGSMFPVGTTSVTCTAKDASNNMATCTFGVNVFSFCLQDDSSPGNVVFVNAFTGDYVFCSGGAQIASGRGNLTVRACQFDIDNTKGNRKVHIHGDMAAANGNGAGSAFIQKTTGQMIILITDKNMSNNSCSCSSIPPPTNPREPDPGKRINGN